MCGAARGASQLLKRQQLPIIALTYLELAVLTHDVLFDVLRNYPVSHQKASRGPLTTCARNGHRHLCCPTRGAWRVCVSRVRVGAARHALATDLLLRRCDPRVMRRCAVWLRGAAHIW